MGNREDIKPKNLKLHDFLVRKIAVKNMLSETVVDKILSHEKKSINSAFKVKNEVEVSGFGKFSISQVKLAKKIRNAEKILERLHAKLILLPGDEDLLAKVEFTHRELDYYRARVKPKL